MKVFSGYELFLWRSTKHVGVHIDQVLAKWVSFMGILGKGRRDARAERKCGLVRAEIGMRGEKPQTPAPACYTHLDARTLCYCLIDLFIYFANPDLWNPQK